MASGVRAWGARRPAGRSLAALILTSASLALAGCGANSDAEPSRAEITAAYGALAQNSAAFYTARADRAPTDESPPITVEELGRNVDYVFTDGVELASYKPDTGVCFTGPHDTFLNVSGDDGPRKGVKRVFGTGDCGTTDGDIVVIDDIDTQHGSSAVVDQFVKGEDLAADVTGLSDFTDYLEHVQQMQYGGNE